MRFKIWTEISGGVTGDRGAYMKENDPRSLFRRELVFETRDEAEAYVDKCKAGRSPYSTFSQRYTIEEFNP